MLTSLHVMTLSNGQIDCRQESQTGEGGGGGGTKESSKSEGQRTDLRTHCQTSRMADCKQNLNRSMPAYILQLNTIFRSLEPLQNQHSSEEG